MGWPRCLESISRRAFVSFKLSARSKKRLKGVHPDLVAVVNRAIELTDIDFGVTEGVRSIETQREYVAKGASRTMKSRHLTGHAVDLVAYLGLRVSWEMPLYFQISAAMKAAAKEQGTRVKWGGDWKTFVDGPHFHLTWKAYPA